MDRLLGGQRKGELEGTGVIEDDPLDLLTGTQHIVY
jgi:hypothetical protein